MTAAPKVLVVYELAARVNKVVILNKIKKKKLNEIVN